MQPSSGLRWVRGELSSPVSQGNTGSLTPYRPGTSNLSNASAITVYNDWPFSLPADEPVYAWEHEDGRWYGLILDCDCVLYHEQFSSDTIGTDWLETAGTATISDGKLATSDANAEITSTFIPPFAEVVVQARVRLDTDGDQVRVFMDGGDFFVEATAGEKCDGGQIELHDDTGRIASGHVDFLTDADYTLRICYDGSTLYGQLREVTGDAVLSVEGEGAVLSVEGNGAALSLEGSSEGTALTTISGTPNSTPGVDAPGIGTGSTLSGTATVDDFQVYSEAASSVAQDNGCPDCTAPTHTYSCTDVCLDGIQGITARIVIAGITGDVCGNDDCDILNAQYDVPADGTGTGDCEQGDLDLDFGEDSADFPPSCGSSGVDCDPGCAPYYNVSWSFSLVDASTGRFEAVMKVYDAPPPYDSLNRTFKWRKDFTLCDGRIDCLLEDEDIPFYEESASGCSVSPSTAQINYCDASSSTCTVTMLES